ncbi:uncharacterized protein LOC114940777 [Nylanderia fulva]|uniref:uncharacterized protein LOC114940777 n=1 Tax=Nylanderia fulva TaxID=613905 RepID=UPI0010FB3DC8|nr:uncharacterized protein LOC114940777 [Nylanderia fulva]
MYGNIHRDGSHKGTPHEPFAQNTAFGWILSGPTVETCPRNSVPAYHTNISPNLEHTLKQFWELEDILARVHPSPEDTQCEEHFVTTHYRTMEGRYVVRLPFRNGPPRDLGDSRFAALKSLERLERRFRTDPSLATEYTAFLTEYANLGHMTKIFPTEFPAQAPAYYIPHRAVIREHSNTTRLRVVFNASCNTATGKSLNSALHVGAKLQTDLVAVVLQWRQPRFALSADIAKMYRQILHLWLTKSDWDDELPAEMLREWETFQLTLLLLEQLTIPRWTQYHPNNRIELHGFADASTRAYAAALYLRVISGDGCITNTLILAKSKVGYVGQLFALPRYCFPRQRSSPT